MELRLDIGPLRVNSRPIVSLFNHFLSVSNVHTLSFSLVMDLRIISLNCHGLNVGVISYIFIGLLQVQISFFCKRLGCQMLPLAGDLPLAGWVIFLMISFICTVLLLRIN